MGYKFICQKVNGEIQHDFVLATKHAVDYSNWYNNNETTIEYAEDIDDLIVNDKQKTIPVGTVEFVEGYYKKYLGINNIKPINVPKELIGYAQRKIWYGDETEVLNLTKDTFCKSTGKVKGFTDIVNKGTPLEKGNYIFSEIIEIESEWRCFVYNGELLGVHNYINSLSHYPDIDVVKEMISNYDKLDAYTLDVGVNDKGTFIIEIHDFYSCGLYGFRDYTKILQMLIKSHNNKLNR